MFTKLAVQTLRCPSVKPRLREYPTRGYAKKSEPTPPPKVEEPKAVDSTSVSKGYTPKPGTNVPPYEGTTNPRDFWKGKYYDLNTRQGQALNDFVTSQNQVILPYLDKFKEELGPHILRLQNVGARATADLKDPIRVCVTGAAGAIGYALLFRIASGGLFGPHVPVSINLLELSSVLPKVKGVEMELRDSAFSVLRDIVITDNTDRAFEGVDYAFLVGAQPRTQGMERGDLLLKNAEIFSIQGKSLNRVAKGKDTRVVVVGNPANTNALIAQRNAPKIPPQNFSAMTRLDHNRGLAQLALKTQRSVTDIDKFVIWGNHSATQFPDISYTTILGKPASQVINDNEWVEKTFIPTVQKRGAEIIAARGASSAASAGSALVDAAKDWHYGTFGKWTSAAVFSNGEYGVQKGLFYSYPVIYDHQKQWHIVNGLPISENSRKKMEITENELISERDAISKLLPS